LNLLAAVAAVVACCWLALRLRVPALARASLGRASTALRDLRDPALGEMERERAARGHARALFFGSLQLVAVSALAIGVPLGGIWLLDGSWGLDAGSVAAWTVHPAFLLGGVGGGLTLWWRRRFRS
jgi:hypothetical protein